MNFWFFFAETPSSIDEEGVVLLNNSLQGEKPTVRQPRKKATSHEKAPPKDNNTLQEDNLTITQPKIKVAPQKNIQHIVGKFVFIVAYQVLR